MHVLVTLLKIAVLRNWQIQMACERTMCHHAQNDSNLSTA